MKQGGLKLYKNRVRIHKKWGDLCGLGCVACGAESQAKFGGYPARGVGVAASEWRFLLRG